MDHRPAPAAPVVGIDLGGTNLRAALIDVTTGRVLGDARAATHAEEGPSRVVERMLALLGEALGRAPSSWPAAVGIGVPGLYSPATGTVVCLPNLPTEWRGVPLAEWVNARTGLPVVLVNDARAFALAEATFGGGRGGGIVLGLTLGTGIGGGIVIDGRLLLGHDGSAGEFGHQILDPYGPVCSCGCRGCLEAYASGPAIAAMGMKAVRQGRTTSLLGLSGGDLNAITPALIVKAAAQGDAVALAILDEAGEFLGAGIATLIALFSPRVIVIGGGLSQAGDWLLGRIRRAVRERCFVTPVDRVRIERAALGDDAGCIGAAVWAAAGGGATAGAPEEETPRSAPN